MVVITEIQPRLWARAFYEVCVESGSEPPPLGSGFFRQLASIQNKRYAIRENVLENGTE